MDEEKQDWDEAKQSDAGDQHDNTDDGDDECRCHIEALDLSACGLGAKAMGDLACGLPRSLTHLNVSRNRSTAAATVAAAALVDDDVDDNDDDERDAGGEGSSSVPEAFPEGGWRARRQPRWRLRCCGCGRR